MAITDLISGLAGALTQVRADLAEVDAQINSLTQERVTTINAPPHADDIAAAFKRGLAVATHSFEQRLGWNLNNANAKGADAAKAAQSAAQLLMINAEQPPSGPTLSGPIGTITAGLFPVSTLAERQGVLDVAAVTYFLRDRIEAEIPALVAKLCPVSLKGLKQADRAAALERLDNQIAELKAKRRELVGNLAAARKATGGLVGQ